MKHAPLLFINTGWQIRYQGPAADDPTLGGFGHLRDHTHGNEAWNFAPYHGQIYGYVPRESSIKLERLGASKQDATLPGVTVVWLARDPSHGQTVIVGWYTNATVHRASGDISIDRAGGHQVAPQIVTDADSATLLKYDQRTFPIPTKKEKGCLGQAPVWYGKDDAFRNSVRAFIARNGRRDPTSAQKKGTKRKNDPERNKMIEVAAVQFATLYYESIEGGERTVHSVEKDDCGWDLNAQGDNDCLKVEVKGVSAERCGAELTHNEFTAMCSREHRAHYVVFIVTGLVGKSPQGHRFRFIAKASTKSKQVWLSQRGQKLVIKPLTAARLSV